MDERTLIQHAAGYLKSLYEGIDPIDKTPVGKNSIFKNEKIMRCLDYTVGVLKRISECENIVHSDYRVFFASGMKREPEVLKRAEMIMKKLSVGVDPFTDKKTDGGDTVRKPRISKCLEYTAFVLSHTTLIKEPYKVEETELDRIVYSDDAVCLSEFAGRLNSIIDSNTMNKVDEEQIVSYLVGIQFLNVTENGFEPAKMGMQLGLSSDRSGEIMLNKTMQKLVVRNMENITKKQ